MKQLILFLLLTSLAMADWTSRNGDWQRGGSAWLNPTSQRVLAVPSSWNVVVAGPSSTRVWIPRPDGVKVFCPDKTLECINQGGTAFLSFYVLPNEVIKNLHAYENHFWPGRPSSLSEATSEERSYVSQNWGAGKLPFATQPGRGVMGYQSRGGYVLVYFAGATNAAWPATEKLLRRALQ